MFENWSKLNLSEIIKSGGDAIKEISNIAETAEQVLEEAAEILSIIPVKNDSGGVDEKVEEVLFNI